MNCRLTTSAWLGDEDFKLSAAVGKRVTDAPLAHHALAGRCLFALSPKDAAVVTFK